MSAKRQVHEGDAIDVLLDYWDSPIQGIVLATRQPYYFQALFDTATDSYSSTYELTLISDETRQLAVELERRWQRMSVGQRRDRTAPSDYDRELNQLKESIARDQQENTSWRATAYFVGIGQDPELPLRVVWSPNIAR
jgi:hypothetical protein